MQEFKQSQTHQDDHADGASVTISAWMDGDQNVTMPDVLQTDQGKNTWQLYHLIGDALRTPELAMPAPDAFSNRLAAALAAEPTILAPHALNSAKSVSWVKRYGWSGFAMAAAVASVVWVAKPFFVPEMSDMSSQVASVTPASVVATTLDPSAVQPYMNAHRQVSGPSSVRQVSFGASR